MCDHALSVIKQQPHLLSMSVHAGQGSSTTNFVCRLHSARKSLPECSAAAESLDNSHANLAVSSHQLLRQPAAATDQSAEAAFQKANIHQSQHSDGMPNGQQPSVETSNDLSQPDAAPQQNNPESHQAQAQPLQPSSRSLRHDSKQATQAAATPAAHVAEHAVPVSAALPAQLTAPAQEPNVQGIAEPSTVPPWEARGTPDPSPAQLVQVCVYVFLQRHDIAQLDHQASALELVPTAVP